MVAHCSRLLFVLCKRTFASDIYITSNAKLRRQAGIKPLNGVKVALLNRSSIGGFSANVLEDYGADVQRFCEPLDNSNDSSNGRLINLSRPEDVNLIKNVARKVDVLIDYLHEKRLETVGLIPEEMLKVNSKLVLARVSGFGSVSGQFGGDVVFAAMSGAMSTIDKKPEDLGNALKEAHALTLAGRSHIITGIIMALYEQKILGKGQIIDFSVTESIAYVKQVSDRSKLKIPDEFHRFYRTADSHLLAVAVINPEHQSKMLDILKISNQSDIGETIGKLNQKELLNQLKDINSVSPIVHVP